MFRGLILLVDRYAGMNRLISGYLTASGFQVMSLHSPGEISDALLPAAHLVLMDYDTAGNDLRSIVERLNQYGVPLVVLTSERDSDARLTSLEMGAADVMSRPLDMAELTARIRAAQSRTMLAVSFANRPPVSFGGLTADIMQYRAALDGEPLDIPPREVALLYLLISAPGRVLSREELSRQLGSTGFSDRTVNIHISRLKKKLGRYADNIESVRGIGYRFRGQDEEPD